MDHDRIVTVTPNPALDRATQAPRVLAGPKLRCLAPRTDPGGGGINVARVVRLLGGHATVVTALGGRTGERLEALLAGVGLETRIVHVGAETRESLTVDDGTTGEQYRFVLPGPTLTRRELDALLAEAVGQVGHGTFVVASGSLPDGAPPELWSELTRRVTEEGGRMVLDTSGEAARASFGQGIEVFRCNDSEMSELCGVDLIDDHEAQERELRRLVDDGAAKIVMMGLGAEGSLVVSADEMHRVPAPHLPKRSAVGAGDSLVGGLTLGLARGWSLLDAATLGVIAGSAAHATPGTELCRRDDVERLFAEQTGRPIPPG